jgi:hypothetical protein
MPEEAERSNITLPPYGLPEKQSLTPPHDTAALVFPVEGRNLFSGHEKLKSDIAGPAWCACVSRGRLHLFSVVSIL